MHVKGKANKIRGFQKRPFVHENAEHGEIWFFPFHNPLSKSGRKVSAIRNGAYRAVSDKSCDDPINVAVNIIADPDWDEARFATVRQWCLDVPEVVNISVNTPYPGTETWMTERRRLISRDYRLFDIQHCVLPTKLPLADFYRELVETQRVLNMKHLGWRTLRGTVGIVAGHLCRGQTNFLKSLFRFNSVYDPGKLLADHARPVHYAVPLPETEETPKRAAIYVHAARGRHDRALDRGTEQFVVETGARVFGAGK
ncbi:hypothetical protein ACMS1Z_18840 [Acidiphilium multivorum]|uniref:hypothetical protein n=1 Tax=Acidiphilium multivorum TaxID=62140 RepID=UPI0039C92F66